MKTCTFFGHRDSPDSLRAEIHEQIEYFIKNLGVKRFYVGTHGSFDRMVCSELEYFKKKIHH